MDFHRFRAVLVEFNIKPVADFIFQNPHHCFRVFLIMGPVNKNYIYIFYKDRRTLNNHILYLHGFFVLFKFYFRR